jgi:hypothetical protein
MSIENKIHLVEQLLKTIKTNRPFKNSHEQLVYERGYLTGLLARLAEEDFSLATKLTIRINKQNSK